MSRKWVSALLSVLLMVTVLAGCGSKGGGGGSGNGSSQGSDAPSEQTTLVYVDGTDLTPMDPAFVTDAPTHTILDLLYDGLVRFKDASMEIAPNLATEWTISDDKKTWTFKLRSGVKFHDGTPFNAEAVKLHIERVMDAKVASPHRAAWGQVKEVQVVDETTVAFVTVAPYPDLLNNLASQSGRIVSPTAAKKAAKPQDFGRTPVGTGPYKLKEWIPGEHAIFDVNPDFWGTKPSIQQITYKGVPEAGTRVAMLKRGEADIIAKLPLEEIDGVNSTAGLKALALPSMFTISFEMLTDKKPFDDVRVRQALNYAVDKEAIVKNIFGGHAVVNNSPISPGLEFRKALTPYPYDPAKAKQLLADAGYANGFKMKLWSPNGRYQKDREVTEAVGGYLRAVGVEVETQIMEWAPYQASTKTNDRDVFMFGRATPGTDFTMSRLYLKQSFDQYNLSRYTNPKVEEWIASARMTFDPKERENLYGQALETIWNDAPYIFLHSQKQTYGMKAGVEGFVPWVHEVVDMRNVRVKK